MDHPLIDAENAELRKRVVQFLKNSYNVQRQSNLIFVCGGNKPKDMRSRFKEYCANNVKKLEVFQPEFAMESLLGAGLVEPFDISEFEELIGSLSRAIVIFPEAAGSFTETGYFSAIETLSKITVLVMDAKRQKSDSFISLGPAKKISEKSIYNPVIQMSYRNPKFEDIIERILNRSPLNKSLRHLNWTIISELSNYELFCLVYEVVRFMTICTYTDLKFMFHSLSNAQYSASKLYQITSILVGAGYLVPTGEYGHFKVQEKHEPLLNVIDGRKDEQHDLKMALANLYQENGGEFKKVVDGV